MVSVARPASLIVKRYRPDSVGVTVPVQRADHAGPIPAGGLVRSTVGSTRVTGAGPLGSMVFQYCPRSPGPVPLLGVSTDAGTIGAATSPLEPSTAVTLTPACAARAGIPCGGV